MDLFHMIDYKAASNPMFVFVFFDTVENSGTNWI